MKNLSILENYNQSEYQRENENVFCQNLSTLSEGIFDRSSGADCILENGRVFARKLHIEKGL
jgi:hypothetical protein